MKIKCSECPYKDECDDALAFGYCPDMEAEEDIGSAIVREMREQNHEF